MDAASSVTQVRNLSRLLTTTGLPWRSAVAARRNRRFPYTATRFRLFAANQSRHLMRGLILALILTVSGSAALAQDRPTRFWNLTRHTIAEFSLAPPGSSNWGPNQCKNDKDGTVDPDERLRITGVQPGTY